MRYFNGLRNGKVICRGQFVWILQTEGSFMSHILIYLFIHPLIHLLFIYVLIYVEGGRGGKRGGGRAENAEGRGNKRNVELNCLDFKWNLYIGKWGVQVDLLDKRTERNHFHICRTKLKEGWLGKGTTQRRVRRGVIGTQRWGRERGKKEDTVQTREVVWVNTYTARPVCWREWISWQLL